MLPSSTVENYLKAIHHGQSSLPKGQRLLPMGHVAAALSVTPGTATTMVKTLAESGLVEYEPYSGVRLTKAGDKLAALVLRRHRLVEAFLVQVMGMSWDDMLGRPARDPHGDPIPTPDGAIAPLPIDNLLTCPTGTALKVTRITDQDPAFLRFVESNNLKPGQRVEVETRDTAADAVRLRRANREPLTIGARAASKLLVEIDRSN